MTTSTLSTVQNRPQQPLPTAKELAPASQDRPQTSSEPHTLTHAQTHPKNLSSTASVSVGLKKALADKQDLMELGKKLSAIMTKLGHTLLLEP